ncbi:glutamate 5-kinase [Desulfurivibrio alkaliphilus]|uniref:Glutamate 5-kinase n=1 Tax=Desulfurivibrio alkaliphilus (strain DSM 19089 / UNIQEM U267 / AHT2) TaxID=589865 RepID=D6Z2S9_DESAT|nr:glutamate 5-kinase [Desulfurivibrio alkaliphilus]ADH85854.1 glutamate 5-kinase [Desulfurivibrio alkaliphilus AHT 2]
MSRQEDNRAALQTRRCHLDKARRVVVKVGSAVLTTGEGLNYEVLDNLAAQIEQLRRDGREVILVSSGAVAAGRRKLDLGNRVLSLREKQAAAAVGQSSLMRAYEKIFEQLGTKVAQVLLTHDAFSRRDRYLNARNTIFTLLQWHLVPVINENDTVSVEELRFGDNDTLGAMVTNLLEADLFVCLTDVDALYNADPGCHADARPLRTVPAITSEIEEMAGSVGSAVGTGGMLSKIKAARMVVSRGGAAVIGPGREPDVLLRLFAGEELGSFFLPAPQKIPSRKHWIAYTLRPKGYLVLDEGACRAILGGGKSLLPSGVVEVRGDFGLGDPVHCLDRSGKPVAAGLVSYDAAAIKRIMGVKTSAIVDILGYKDSDEVIHRDNLVIL